MNEKFLEIDKIIHKTNGSVDGAQDTVIVTWVYIKRLVNLVLPLVVVKLLCPTWGAKVLQQKQFLEK